MKLFKGDSLRIEMQDDYSLKITPAQQAIHDSEETGGTTPGQLKEEVPTW
ncbi:MAG: hypothetical protein NHB15_16915 [Methanosarcina barkeri]|nr:hypothetical protein [Methanosarcina sp. ERenArc_MAG2]